MQKGEGKGDGNELGRKKKRKERFTKRKKRWGGLEERKERPERGEMVVKKGEGKKTDNRKIQRDKRLRNWRGWKREGREREEV